MCGHGKLRNVAPMVPDRTTSKASMFRYAPGCPTKKNTLTKITMQIAMTI
jgi:hypothetical protein